MLVCAEVACTVYNKGFEKPLNPILGETYQALGQDGSKLLSNNFTWNKATFQPYAK